MTRLTGLPSTRTPLVAEDQPFGRGALAWNGPWLGASLTAMCLLSVSSVALASPAFVVSAGVTDYRLAFITEQMTQRPEQPRRRRRTSQPTTCLPLSNTSMPATTWKAIVGIATMRAANNISCGATRDANLPIFLVDGTEVATSTLNLFGGSVGGYVWTSSTSNGTAASGTELGSWESTTGWNVTPSLMLSFARFDDTEPLPIYAISGELPAVPEPATLSLLAFGGMAIALARKLRRRRPPAH